MKPLGIIDQHRLRLVPKSCHAAHEFCFRLYDQMAQLLVEGDAHGADGFLLTFNSEEQFRLFESSDDSLSQLIQSGHGDIHKRIILNQVTRALLSDFLNFVYESLRTLEKRKYTVSMSLLRKPLRENLMFATWMRADSDDFYHRLKSSPAELMESNYLTPDRRKAFIKLAISKSKGMDFADEGRLYQIIYDKTNPSGFATLFDKATHLVTSHPSMRTEELNLNFIFKNPNDNDVFEVLYSDLAYVLMYANVLMISLYSEMARVQENYLDYILLTSLGAYSSLFIQGKNRVANEMNVMLRDFLKCPYCGVQVRISKSNAPHFFLTESLHCDDCGLEHTFPLHWLLSIGKFKLSERSKQ